MIHTICGKYFMKNKFRRMNIKRKHVSVPLVLKLDALKRLDEGENMKQVANELGVSIVTVGDWKRNRAKIEKWKVGKSSEITYTRSRMRKTEYEKTGEALFLWFSHQRQNGYAVTGPMLQEKALHYKRILNEGENDFSASSGWIDRWKKRYGVRLMNNFTEVYSTDLNAVKEFIDFTIAENLTLDQIYIYNVFGLNYKMLPYSFVSHQEFSQNNKNYSRVTVLACSNLSGTHKLKLVIIGKQKLSSKNTEEIQNIHVMYKNGFILDKDVFKQWFFEDFVKETEYFLKENKLSCKAILMLGSELSYQYEDNLSYNEIKAIYFPSNITKSFQPLKQEIVQQMKKNFRKKLLHFLLEIKGEVFEFESLLEKISIEEVLYWVSESWSEMRSTEFTNLWYKLINIEILTDHKGLRDELIKTESEEFVLLLRQLPGCESGNESSVKEWFDRDNVCEITDDEIIEMVQVQSNLNLTQENTNLKTGKIIVKDHLNIKNCSQTGYECHANDSVSELLNCAEECKINDTFLHIVNDHSDELNNELKTEESRISHREGLSALEVALSYISQQPEVLPTDVFVLKKWREFAAKQIN